MVTGVAQELEEETAMDTGVVPEPEEGDVLIPDSVMLVRIGRTHCHNSLCAARKAVNGNKTAVQVDMDSGHSFYVSFTLVAPPQGGGSYLDLHWPEGSAKSLSPYARPAYPYVRAIDKELVLFHVSIPSQTRHCAFRTHLFVYTAAGPSPSVQQLPPYHDDRRIRPFLRNKSTTGILRRQDGRYIVADLILDRKEKPTGNYYMCAELCIFNSNSRAPRWRLSIQDAPKPQDQSNGQFPTLWSTDHVLALDGRFLCWVDYFSGVLLSDFCNLRLSPVLHFVPFPGEEEYTAKVREERCFAERFRSVSVSQGKMRFVHIDNDLHTDFHTGCCPWLPGQKITIWTLKMMDGDWRFKWEPHRVIDLDRLWVTPSVSRRLPEYPIISPDHPDVLYCLLRKQEFHGEASMLMVDMNHESLWSCTPYINRQSVHVKDHKSEFPNIPLLPTVFFKYLERSTGMPWDNDKLATRASKKFRLQCEDLESGGWC